MRKNKKETSDKRFVIPFFPISLVLLCLVLITTALMNGLYARFSAEEKDASKAQAAAFVYTVSGTSSESWFLGTEDVTKPGDSKASAFTVTNTSGTTISEVSESVTMTVRINGSMPIKCTVKDSKGNNVLTLDATEEASLPASRTSDAVTMNAGTAFSENYVLTVEWPKDRNDAAYASVASGESVELVIDAVQLD